MKNINFKGAIFDLDGTLLDSMSVWHEVDSKFFKRHGLEMPDNYQDAVKNMHFPTAAQYTKNRFSLSETTDEIMAEWCELCYEAYESQIKLKNGALEFLTKLYKNDVKIAYATANEEKLCKAVLGSNRVWDFFSARAYVSETGKSKAEPDVYLLAAERMGLLPSECAVFEDILQGVKGAKKGGFTVFGVYDESNIGDMEEIKGSADFYITDFEELL